MTDEAKKRLIVACGGLLFVWSVVNGACAAHQLGWLQPWACVEVFVKP